MHRVSGLHANVEEKLSCPPNSKEKENQWYENHLSFYPPSVRSCIIASHHLEKVYYNQSDKDMQSHLL